MAAASAAATPAPLEPDRDLGSGLSLSGSQTEIGGTLDTIVGTVKRAPEFFCRFNIEWFYRLITNPKRIRRQMVLPVFVLRVLKEKYLI